MHTLHEYILHPGPQIIREIAKRGQVTQRKDEEGNVVKKKNELGPGSMFGWGAVNDTIPVLKKDLEHLRKNLRAILKQVAHKDDDDSDGEGELEEEIEQLFELEQKKNNKRESHFNAEVRHERRVLQKVSDANVNPVAKKPKSTVRGSLLEQWYQSWSHEHEIGNLGQVPEPFQGVEKPSLAEIQQTVYGKVLNHFLGFMKRLF